MKEKNKIKLASRVSTEGRVELNDKEKDIYRGSGMVIAYVHIDEIIRFQYLGDLLLDNIEIESEKLIVDALEWKNEKSDRYIYYGLLSCFGFCGDFEELLNANDLVALAIRQKCLETDLY